MKKESVFYLKYIFLFFLLVNVLKCNDITAAPLYFEPVSKQLPDGTTINLFISGDEFFNYLHDENEFPLQKGDDGYYYYLLQEGDKFNISKYRYPASDPFLITGLKKVSIPSYVEGKREAFYKKMDEETLKKEVKEYNKSSGTFNNLVIYLRFKDETDFVVQRSVYESRLNSLTNSSMRYYYQEISYNKLDVVSYNFPGGSTSNIYYTDVNKRNYYQPYSATTNPDGYNTDAEKAIREHSLLASAVSWATANYSLPEGVNFDVNQDGIVDNVCFIIRGASDGWSDLLWPHRWVLYTQTVKVGNLKVYGYTLQMENVGINTLCHEMFHALGAPDLYHYNNSERAVGPWDIMANGSCHPGAWMKYKYGGWINQINEISESGTYIIKPLVQEKKNSYLIRSPYRTDQFFMLEFRKKTGSYESNLPASGLIIQRIDSRYRGNSNGPPDEIYVFRYNGSLSGEGDISKACFSDLYSRTSFSDYTNPYSFFQDGSQTGIKITNILSMGDSMSFTIDMDQPVELTLNAVEDSRITGSWKSLSNKEFLVAASTYEEDLILLPGYNYTPGDKIGVNGEIIQRSTLKSFSHENLISDQLYYYTVWAITKDNPPLFTSPAKSNIRTGIYVNKILPYEQSFDDMVSELPRGWKSTSGTSGWQLNQEAPFSAPGSILMKAGTQNQEEWFYTPGFELFAANSYMISFRYKNKAANVLESFTLGGGTERYNNGLSMLNLFSSGSFDYKEYALFRAIVKPLVSKPYYFGFKRIISGQGVLIDDFRIEKVPAKTTQHTNPVEFYPNPTGGLITVPAIGYTRITVFRTDGTMIYETSIEAMQEIDLSFLGKGLFLIRFSTSEKSATGKLIIQ